VGTGEGSGGRVAAERLELMGPVSEQALVCLSNK